MSKRPPRKPPRPRSDDREILYGIAPVEAALRAGKRELFKLWLRSEASHETEREAQNPRVEAILRQAEARKLAVVPIGAEELARRAHSGLHQGVVLGCGPLPLLGLRDLLDAPARASFVLALDRIEDPQNLGGLVRTAAFLGVSAVLLHRSHRAPLSATVSKASAGLLEEFAVAEVGNLADALQTFEREGWQVLGSALDEAAVDYRALAPSASTVLVMGNEGRGLRPLTRKRCGQLVWIPRRGDAESLNVTVAAGILLAHLVPGANPV